MLQTPYIRLDADSGRTTFIDNNLTATDEIEIAAGAAGTKRIIYFMTLTLNWLTTATTPKNVRVFVGGTIIGHAVASGPSGGGQFVLPHPIVVDGDIDLRWVGSYNVAEYQRWLTIVYADVPAF